MQVLPITDTDKSCLASLTANFRGELMTQFTRSHSWPIAMEFFI